MPVHRVGLLAFDGMTLLDVAGPVQVFTEANTGRHRYDISLVGLGPDPVRTSSGIQMAVDEVAGDQIFDTFIVPGSDGAPAVEPALIAAVQRLAASSTRVVSICTGSFLLAEAGLLDGQQATTHWRYADLLRRRYPSVSVDADSMFVRAGSVFTSAGVTAGIDLALALVEDDHGPEMARTVARLLVVFMQRPGGQSQFSARLDLPHTAAGPVRAALDAVTADPTAPHTAQSLAERAGVSIRHLTRLFRHDVGLTPREFVEASRLEIAKQLILSGMSVTATASASGFGSDETLRRAFQRHVGLTPLAYRRRFATTRAWPAE